MIRESELDPTLATCLRALGPYLDQLVVAGGWAPYLYCRMYENELQREPLITRDFDAAVDHACDMLWDEIDARGLTSSGRCAASA